jgi:putative pyruvate formate lyase activating enzyme
MRALIRSSKADQKENIHTVFLSLMSQYTPIAKVHSHPILKRRIAKSEYEQVTDYALKLGFNNVFVQEVNDYELTPDFG